MAFAFILLAAVSTCVPINSDMLWVTFPDGKGDYFLREGEENVFAGPEPWFAVARPERHMVNVATKSSYRGRACEYGFVDGYLRFASEGGKDREVAVPAPPKPMGSARGFWPTDETVAELRKKNDMWKGSGRLRFISRNPNRTALFLAQLCLVALGVAMFGVGRGEGAASTGWRGLSPWRIHGAVWTLIFLILQFQALSRGGILAFLAGVAAMVFFKLKGRWNVRHLIVAGVSGALLLGACLFVYRNRLTKEISDDSSQSRTAIWREVPRMIAAAPWGWGMWQSGEAYNAWFEKPGRCHLIGDLFNDHLSRFVEGGFGWGGLYVFAWSLVLVAGWRWGWHGGSPVFLAVWLAYFVASSFNPMNYWAKSFWVPGAVSAVWVWRMLRGLDSRGRDASSRQNENLICPHQTRRGAASTGAASTLVWSLALTAAILAGVSLVAVCAPAQDVPLRVSALGRRTVVGRGEPQVWVADDGFVLNGNFNGYPGREIRSWWPKHPTSEALGIVTRVEDLPPEIDRLVLTGTCGEDYLKMAHPPKAKHLVFLTPPFASDKIPVALRESCDVHLVTGHFAALRTGDAARREKWIHVMPGAQVFVPGWLGIVLRERKDDAS